MQQLSSKDKIQCSHENYKRCTILIECDNFIEAFMEDISNMLFWCSGNNKVPMTKPNLHIKHKKT